MFAVFKRDFVAYFLNPTGYVFICVFVLLGSASAFLPDDFVNSNLANLTQLNLRFPLVSLIFIPAVTMGIWAEEKRNGTGELLLTSPLSTRQIVLGKYGAAVGVYFVSLLFSFGSNWAVLSYLGRPDFGLFMTTYLGYGLTGLLMLSFGMLASFLTSQLTVAYILGALLNVPLVAFAWADAFPFSKETAGFLKNASLESFFEPFGRGIVSLSGLLYFTLIPATVLYVCWIMADFHHWSARRPGWRLFHYGIRTTSLILLTTAIVGMVRQYDLRSDRTEEKLSSLSPESMKLIDDFSSDYPTVIEAFISPEVPPEYAKTRLDLIAFLNEIQNRLGSRVFLSIHSIQPNTEAAYQLEKRYDIRPKRVAFETRGRLREDSIFLTVLFRSGPKTVAIPFMNRGLSVEYELVSSLINVGNRVKKRIGVLKTDAFLFGRLDQYGNSLLPRWPIIDELARQYSVEEVNPAEPIPADYYDALIAVEPSSLDPGGMAHFAEAVARGDATITFEDPFPIFAADFLSGTNLPKKFNPTLGIYPGPKGEIGQIWSMLGILFGKDVLWSHYNPYPKLAFFSEEFLFVDAKPIRLDDEEKKPQTTKSEKSTAWRSSDFLPQKGGKEIEAFSSTEKAVSSLSHLLFPFAGYFVPNRNAGTTVVPLIQAEAGGTASVAEENVIFAGVQSHVRKRTDRAGAYMIAARITGEIPKMFRKPDDVTIPQLNTILVADLDFLTPGIFRLREEGNDLKNGVRLDSDNVTFVLNAIDSIAGDDPFITIRSRRTRHRTLTTIEEATREIQNKASLAQISFYKDLEAIRQLETDKMNRRIAEMVNRNDGMSSEKISSEDSAEIQSAMVAMEDRLKKFFEEKTEQYNRKVEESRRQVNEMIRKIQGRYKLYAVLFPPILPLAIGLGVFLRRRIARRRDRRSV